MCAPSDYHVPYDLHPNVNSGYKIREILLPQDCVVGEHLCVLPPIIIYHMTSTLTLVVVVTGTPH